MHFNTCCNEREFPRDIVLEHGEYFCTLCGTCLGCTFVWDYKDYQNYKIKKSRPYDAKNHARHVLNCVQCLESGKPSLSVINKLKKGGTSKEDLNKNAWRKVRKHLTYVWCELNQVDHLRILPEHIDLLVSNICETPRINQKRKSYHKIIKEVIHDHPEMKYILRYLNLPKKSRESLSSNCDDAFPFFGLFYLLSHVFYICCSKWQVLCQVSCISFRELLLCFLSCI